MSFNNEPSFKREEDSEDSIEELKEDLYSRGKTLPPVEEGLPVLKKHSVSVAEGWQSGDAPAPASRFMNAASRLSFLKKIFLASLAFFLAAVAVSLYIFFAGSNIVSSNNVAISVVAPVSVSGGETLTLEISVANQNNTALKSVDLLIEYPEGARSVGDLNTPLKRERLALGDIQSGRVATKKVEAVLFGEEGAVKNIAIGAEYRVAGSNAILSKKKIYTVVVNSSPVSLSVASVKEINSNQEVILTAEVVSNASSVIENLALSAEYPFGFSFSGAEPPPAAGSNFWQLGDLRPGGKRAVKIRGKVVGQEGDDRTFRFSVGTENPANQNRIGTAFLTSSQKITVRKPFIDLALALDGDSSDAPYIAKTAKSIRVDLSIGNSLASKISDLKVKVSPTGDIFDPASVSANGGYYRSSDNTVLWDQTLQSSLGVMDPGGTGIVSFSFATLPAERIVLNGAHEINLFAEVSGKRLGENGLSETVSSSVSRKIKVASALGLSARALYYSGAFKNTGPLPPKVGSETTYTIVWSLSSSLNDIRGARVSAILPSYVRWLGAILPEAEKISYNPIGGEVLWEAGDIKAGVGFSESPKQVSFQVALLPGLSQTGSAPNLLGETIVRGEDGFAGVSLETRRPSLTTDIATDTVWRPEEGKVVR